MENKTGKRVLGQKTRMAVITLLILLIVSMSLLIFNRTSKKQTDLSEVITVSTLEKIINVSELSTFTAVYNGVAQVMNEENPEKTDYYVSYEAKVDAGFDFEKMKIYVDDEIKTITVILPQIYITDVNVDIASLDFIFYNRQADQSTVTHEAFKACEMDVQNETAQQDAILDLAQQNAINVVTALISPFIEQLDADYQLNVKQGE